MGSPLLSAAALVERLAGPEPPALLDIRWELASGARRDLYEQGHIPDAAFVDLDRALAGPPGDGGRHPLPPAGDFQSAMRAAGVEDDRAVVVYDAATSTAAARAWWLLRYFGHAAVAVLDGGLAAWTAAGGSLATGSGDLPPARGSFTARPGALPVLDADGALAAARSGLLLDARAPERFRGEHEPIDPVAGHIPGARNRPTTENLQPDGCFKAPERLRAELGALPRTIGVYCGSGVTAAHEVLALELAGYRAALYPGSWSDWIRDPSRPICTTR